MNKIKTVEFMFLSSCLESTYQSVQTNDAVLEALHHLVLWIAE
jgi:hypothetical protein